LFLTVLAPVRAADDPAPALLAEVNRVRAEHGLGPLGGDARLAAAASRHARAMAEGAFLDHRSPDGTGLAERAAAAGYRYRFLAENIAAGHAAPAAVVRGWMNSDGHRRNLLQAEAVEAGAGYAFRPRERGSPGFRHYWVLVLAAPR
jgi:uncharacterized protein YkwD